MKKNYFPGHMVLYTENPKNSTNTRIYGSTTGFLDTWINIEKLIFLYSTAAKHNFYWPFGARHCCYAYITQS